MTKGTTQLPLGPVRTLYRVDDPQTSGLAADEHDARGSRARHADLVLASVHSLTGLTAGEYGERTGLGHIEAQRRLSDLKNAHLVRAGEPRRCGVKGSRMVTWFPVYPPMADDEEVGS